MKLLVNGGSISRGKDSWPYVIQEHYKCDLVNLAQTGSGNSYIHETTISELAQRSYDLVIVQWSHFTKFDFKADNLDLFDGTVYTSQYQSRQNDWPEKQIVPVNDQDYVEKDWIFGCGYYNGINDQPHMVQAFEGYYKYAKHSQLMYHSLMRYISLQSFLKANNINYLFVFNRPLKILVKYKHLENLLDWDRIYTDYDLLEMVKNDKWYDVDCFHPDRDTQQSFASKLIKKIDTII